MEHNLRCSSEYASSLAYSYHNPFIGLTSKLDNAPNQGGFSWTVGHDDGINASLLAINPKMVFQLNDANGADGFTLDSRGFLVLAVNATEVPQSTPSTTVPSTLQTSRSSTTSSSASSGLPTASPPAGSGLSTAAKVNIGLGVPLIVVLGMVIVLLIMLLRRGKRAKHMAYSLPLSDVQTKSCQ